MNEQLIGILKMIAAVAVIAVIPFLYRLCRIFSKRMAMRSELMRTCKLRGLELLPTHSFWMFGRNGGAHCDFYLVGKRTAYAVKLFTTRSYHMELHFTDDGRYYTRKYLSFNAWDTRYRRLVAYDFREGLRPEWRMKEIVPVLLINPICREIDYVTRNVKMPLGAGDVVNNMRIYTISRLLEKLEAI